MSELKPCPFGGSGSVDSEQPEIKTDRTTGDSINRQQAIDALCNDYCGGHQDCKYYPNCENLKSIERLPFVQPEQKKGKWERVYLDHVASGERPSIFYCSSCNQCVPFPTNFCPACGSDNRQS